MQKIEVLTSQMFAGRVGRIVSQCRRTITVNFGTDTQPEIGIYTRDKNQFVIK